MTFSRYLIFAVDGLVQGCEAALRLAQRHPRRLTALVGAAVLGMGATAYAVSTVVPDPSTLPVREVVQSVTPLPPAQAKDEAAPIAPFVLYRSEVTRSSDSADSLLRRLGVVDAQAAKFLRTDTLSRQSLLGRGGHYVRAETDGQHALIRLSARWAEEDSTTFKRLVIERHDEHWRSRIESAPLQASTRMGSGVIKSSLFAATDEARIHDAVAIQLAEVFSGDIDFYRALRRGDRFSVIYEVLEADGEPLRTGRVLSADFVNNGKTFSAVWFHEPGADKGAYYTLDGNSLRKAFLVSPIEFSRVTSGFGGRIHPIAKQFRMHNGVDYAAPTGTPIRSVGDGVVAFAGVRGGYGNVVELMHRDQKSTLYAHMSRIDVRQGQRVAQGDRIGAVGSTGWSTGPHLHFEFRINGVHHDPMTLARQSESAPISASARAAFNQMVGQVRRDLAAASSLRLASAQ